MTLAVALACGVALADLATKALAAATIDLGEREPILPALDLVHVRNPGVAFGLLAAAPPAALAGLTVALATIVLALLVRAGGSRSWLAAGLLLGGAAGNLIDRLPDGYVTDWLDLPLWPSFNLADIAIVGSMLALVVTSGSVGRGGPR